MRVFEVTQSISIKTQAPQHTGGSSRAVLWPPSMWWVRWWKPERGSQTCSTSDETWKRERVGIMHVCWGKTQKADQSGPATFQSSYQILFRMKKSWMKMQPKGRIPPITIPGIGLVKKDCSGICRGIWFVRTGCSIACAGNRDKKRKEEYNAYPVAAK